MGNPLDGMSLLASEPFARTTAENPAPAYWKIRSKNARMFSVDC